LNVIKLEINNKTIYMATDGLLNLSTSSPVYFNDTIVALSSIDYSNTEGFIEISFAKATLVRSKMRELGFDETIREHPITLCTATINQDLSITLKEDIDAYMLLESVTELELNMSIMTQEDDEEDFLDEAIVRVDDIDKSPLPFAFGFCEYAPPTVVSEANWDIYRNPSNVITEVYSGANTGNPYTDNLVDGITLWYEPTGDVSLQIRSLVFGTNIQYSQVPTISSLTITAKSPTTEIDYELLVKHHPEDRPASEVVITEIVGDQQHWISTSQSIGSLGSSSSVNVGLFYAPKYYDVGGIYQTGVYVKKEIANSITSSGSFDFTIENLIKLTNYSIQAYIEDSVFPFFNSRYGFDYGTSILEKTNGISDAEMSATLAQYSYDHTANITEEYSTNGLYEDLSSGKKEVDIYGNISLETDGVNPINITGDTQQTGNTYLEGNSEYYGDMYREGDSVTLGSITHEGNVTIVAPEGDKITLEGFSEVVGDFKVGGFEVSSDVDGTGGSMAMSSPISLGGDAFLSFDVAGGATSPYLEWYGVDTSTKIYSDGYKLCSYALGTTLGEPTGIYNVGYLVDDTEQSFSKVNFSSSSTVFKTYGKSFFTPWGEYTNSGHDSTVERDGFFIYSYSSTEAENYLAIDGGVLTLKYENIDISTSNSIFGSYTVRAEDSRMHLSPYQSTLEVKTDIVDCGLYLNFYQNSYRDEAIFLPTCAEPKVELVSNAGAVISGTDVLLKSNEGSVGLFADTYAFLNSQQATVLVIGMTPTDSSGIGVAGLYPDSGSFRHNLETNIGGSKNGGSKTAVLNLWGDTINIGGKNFKSDVIDRIVALEAQIPILVATIASKDATIASLEATIAGFSCP